MAIVSVTLNDGDPTIQASGEYRGTVNFEFDDGRIVTRNLRAPDEDAWSALMLRITDEVQRKQELQDAEEGVSPDSEITANKQASIKQRAVAYLRAAWEQEIARDAYLLFDKFNDYRLAQGWNLNQVQAGLAEAGLTVDEWDSMRTAYSYLSASGRPAIMNDYQTIQANWEARD